MYIRHETLKNKTQSWTKILIYTMTNWDTPIQVMTMIGCMVPEL